MMSPTKFQKGTKFQRGEKLFTVGLTIKCRRVVIAVTFVKYLEWTRESLCEKTGHVSFQDCVTKSQGIKVIDDSRQLCRRRRDVSLD